MKNKSEDLRNHLFATLEALQDKENPMELDRAKTIADVAQVIINSAKVEVEFARATGLDADRLPFFADTPRLTSAPEPTAAQGDQPRIVHKIK
jgi:hypothetical protein